MRISSRIELSKSEETEHPTPLDELEDDEEDDNEDDDVKEPDLRGLESITQSPTTLK